MEKHLFELLAHRRSVRHFTEQKVEQDKVEKIMEAALKSPSSKNTRPWHFYIVENKELIEKLAQSKPMGGRFLKGAPLAIVVAADTTKTDMTVEDSSIASTMIQLAADALGLGSCWIQIRGRYHDQQNSSMAEEYIRELLNIEPQMQILNIIAIGYDLNERISRDNGDDSDKITYLR